VTNCVSLADVGQGQSGTVLVIQAGFGLTSRLDSMGIRPGVRLEKISGSPFHGPVTIRVGNVNLALGHGMAAKILVQIEAPPRGGPS